MQRIHVCNRTNKLLANNSEILSEFHGGLTILLGII